MLGRLSLIPFVPLCACSSPPFSSLSLYVFPRLPLPIQVPSLSTFLTAPEKHSPTLRLQVSQLLRQIPRYPTRWGLKRGPLL